ncbi:MAG: DNA polymerase III subunit alpha [Planctomycetia bacterium]|nr:DNA polymerase III subunit alpha [Planctomycetia bacterium]
MSDENIEDFIDNPEELEEEFEEEEHSEPSQAQEQPETSESDSIPFVHLHTHSHYSLLDGAGKLEALISRAKELNMPALAITDHGNMYGILEFYQKALDAGIKPILGFEAYLAHGKRFEHSKEIYHVTLLAMNNEGYHNLLRLSSLAFTEGFYYKPRIDHDLLQQYNEGIICLSGCLSGEVARTLVNGAGKAEAYEKALKIAQWYKSVFGDRYYIELQDHGIPEQKVAFEAELRIAQELGIPTVATNDVHYVRQEDAVVQDLILCINTSKFVTDPNRMRMDSDQFYLKSGQEMLQTMPTAQDAVHRSVEIAQRCNVELELGKRFFPIFNPPDNLTSDEYLRKLCIEGLKRRYANNAKRLVNGELTEEVMARLNRELSVISKLGFANYFLIVWDFVREAEERGIHRTARGSGVGALVCYALNMSHVCPLEFDLLFERFLDENRLEAPDIDIDFDQSRRGEIIDYVKKRYGEDKVAQLGVFGTMAAKLAIRDCGRALGIPLSMVNQVAKLVPGAPKMTIKKAFANSPELVELYQSNQDVRELIDFAQRVEGLARNSGTHACGVIISQRALTDFVPIHRITGKEDVVTQWQGAEVEKAGLLKMDFLGLRNLTILADSVRIIEQTTGKKIDPYNLPQNDPETYALLCRGETKGVFQLESEGIRGLLVRMAPDNIRDLIAVIALFRPGPLEGGMVDEYVDVKHGRKKATYLHPVLKEVLEETHGVMVYQEQIMRILNKLGKIPLSQSYTCIKAISKKKEDKIVKFHADFVEGAKQNNLTEAEANELFDLIKKFAGYGFNKSHSTAYANVAYTTAYLKAHYPAEFMAALLCGDISGRNFTRRDKTVEHIDDCKRMGIEVVPPNINISDCQYRVVDGKILFGLEAIRACGGDAMRAIVEERDANGPYRDFFDFYRRIDVRRVSRSAVEALIKSGAFDFTGAKRSAMFLAIEKALKTAQQLAQDRNRGQMSLFGSSPAPTSDNANSGLPDVEEWDAKERAAYEKENLGFYVTTHPLEDRRGTLELFACSTVEASKLPNRTQSTIGGAISDVQIKTLRNPKPNHPNLFAIFQIEDLESSMRAIIWAEQYAKYSSLLQNDAVVFLKGRIEQKEIAASEEGGETQTETTFIVDQVIPFDDAASELSRGVAVILRESELREDSIKTLYDVVKTYRNGHSGNASGSDLEIWLYTKNGEIATFHCPQIKLNITNEMKERVELSFGKNSFRLLPAPQKRQTESRYKNWSKKRSYN